MLNTYTSRGNTLACLTSQEVVTEASLAQRKKLQLEADCGADEAFEVGRHLGLPEVGLAVVLASSLDWIANQLRLENWQEIFYISDSMDPPEKPFLRVWASGATDDDYQPQCHCTVFGHPGSCPKPLAAVELAIIGLVAHVRLPPLVVWSVLGLDTGKPLK